MSATLQQIAQRIKQANGVVICTHMRPDGDALGSALALSRALTCLGIQNAVLDETDVPDLLSFLDGAEGICKKPPFDGELYVNG